MHHDSAKYAQNNSVTLIMAITPHKLNTGSYGKNSRDGSKNADDTHETEKSNTAAFYCKEAKLLASLFQFSETAADYTETADNDNDTHRDFCIVIETKELDVTK